MKRLVQVAALVFAITTLAPVAEAGVPPILRRPTGKPMWIEGTLGPTFYASGWGGTGGKLGFQFGYHFTGQSWGPAIAGDFNLAFGSGIFGLEVVPRFVWDIPVLADLGLYLSPSAGVGFGYLSLSGTAYLGGSAVGGVIQFGFEGKLLIGQKGFVSFRPVGIDVVIFADATWVFWDFLFGGGMVF